jgi:hypothetical protein
MADRKIQGESEVHLNKYRTYLLINHLIKQYERLHAESFRERNLHHFREASAIEMRGRWLLDIADKLLDVLQKTDYLIPSEKVQFD